MHLTVPLATWLGLTSTPGEAAGCGPLDAAASRDLAALLAARPGNHWCLTITTPDGRAAGHGCARAGPPAGTGPPGARAGPGPPGPGSNPWPPGQRNKPGPPGPGGDPTWLAGITIRWLQTGDCGHPRETRAYQPSPALRHLVKIRDRTCSYPGCRRAARRCDDDHTRSRSTRAGEPASATSRLCAAGTTPPSRPPAGTSSSPGSPAPSSGPCPADGSTPSPPAPTPHKPAL
ncbi:MAG TPA: hypothetical protein VK162_15235 [Streptosporangiaceae bacterium]|nr:hypothetical protein [Streptosporangiaceae bacterium]